MTPERLAEIRADAEIARGCGQPAWEAVDELLAEVDALERVADAFADALVRRDEADRAKAGAS